MVKFLPVAGTHGWSGKLTGEWWQKGSPFLDLLRSEGFEPYDAEDPFVWDTGIAGIPWVSTSRWYAAGLNLKHYDGFGGDPVRIVAHSHGAQIVAYAAAKGLRIQSLITVGSPVREDMRPVWAAARPNIAHWTHCYSDWSDKWQIAGGLWDGTFGIRREFHWENALGEPMGADRNLALPGVGHSGILTDPEHFDVWQTRHLFAALAL